MTHSYNLGSALGQQLRRLGLTALLAGGTALAAQAQLAYNPALASTNAGTYTDLGTTGAAVTMANNDNANSAAQNIGFTFNFNGTAFTQFVMNTNGLIRLGANAPSSALAASLYAQSPDTGPINSTNAADVNLIMPFNFDLGPGTSTPEFRIATTGTAPNRVCTIQWKNMSDKAIAASAASATIAATQYTNFSFQAKLYETTNQIEFVYNAPTVGTDNTLKYSVVGIKGSTGTDALLAFKPSAQPWSATTFDVGPLLPPAQSNSHNFRSIAPPDAGRTYRFPSPVPNDGAVLEILTLGKLPRTALPHVVQVVVANYGTTPLTAVQVTLTVTGANSFTMQQPIASLPLNSQDVANFTLPTSFVAGVNTLTATIPADGNNNNNSQTTQQTVTRDGTFSYVPTDRSNTIVNSFGTPANTAGTSSAGATYTAAFTTVTAGTVPSVSVFIADVNTVGRSLQGVVIGASGAIVGSSALVTITAADINTYKTFVIANPPTIPANGTFQAGLSIPAYNISATAPRFFPLGFQTETGARASTFFNYATPTPTASTTPTDYMGYRFMIETRVLNALAASTSKVLTRAISVYPNPSASGVFNLDVQNASASNGLGVEVTNQLGQRVYTGTARDNNSTQLDLSNLAPGIYHLVVRNGSDFTSQQISIAK